MFRFFNFLRGAHPSGEASNYWEIDSRGRGHWHDADTHRYTRAPREDEMDSLLKEQGFKVDPNLVINTVNLGVSIYNAYQLRVVRKQLTQVGDDVRATRAAVQSFRDEAHAQHEATKALLAGHSALLTQLSNGQSALADRLDVLRRAVEDGFANTAVAIVGATEERRTDELFRHTQNLMRYSDDLIDAIGTELQRPAAERVINSATELLGWLDGQIERTSPGDPARLPLLAAKAAALRWRVDARAFEGFPQESLLRERTAFANEVAREAFSVIDGTSIHAVACQRRELIAAYVFLHRAFTTPHMPGVDDDGREVPLFPVGTFAWDDHLDAVRAALMTTVDAPKVTRSTPLDSPSLASVRWLRAWRAGNVGDVLDAIGAPSSVDDAAISHLEGLRPFVTAAGRDEVADRLQREFGWDEAPAIVSVEVAR